MANWKRIVEGPGGAWEDRETREGNMRVEVYHDQGSTSGALPAFDSSLGDGTPRFVSDIRKIKMGGHFNKQLAVVTYTPRTGEEGNTTIAFSDLKREMQIGGELLSIDATNSYYWGTDGDPANQKVFKRIVTGTYTVQEAVSDLNIGTTGGALAKIILHAGKVNRGTFQGESSGTWLYLGAGLDERRNELGNKFWLVEHGFSFRKIPNSAIAGNVAIGDNEWGWIKQWRDDAGQWDVVSDTPGWDWSTTTYQPVAFSNIFSTSNVS